MGYLDKNSIDYKNLRTMVEMTMIDVFEKIQGFLGIFDVDFEQGSVIANIKTEVSSENTQVSTSSLAKAVIDAGDEDGRLGQLHLDTAFLQEQITPTTPPTTETSNEEDDNDMFVGVGIGIGLAALICFTLAVCLLYYFKKKTSEKMQPNVIELNPSEVGSYHNRRFDAYYEE